MKTWSDLFAMGVEELDQDHKRLLRTSEMIVERLDSPEADPKQWPFLVREGLRYLDGYYRSHLQREEDYMRRIDYPNYEAHKRAHEELGQIVTKYISAYIDTKDGTACDLEGLLKLMGATYGWQMIHTAMDDMAIVGKGVMVLPPETELTNEAMIREINTMMKSVLGFDAHTKIIDDHYEGDRLYSAVCQKIRCDVGGREVTILLGLERCFLQYAAETFWPDKHVEKKTDKAHTVLMQWCLSAFAVGFWRAMVGRFAYDRPFTLKEAYPLAVKDSRPLMRKMNCRRSVLYETSKGRFFAVSDY